MWVVLNKFQDKIESRHRTRAAALAEKKRILTSVHRRYGGGAYLDLEVVEVEPQRKRRKFGYR